MSDINAFHTSIRENPDDNTARLVFADFLEETGVPRNVARAQLIRAQCAMAERGVPPDPELIQQQYEAFRALFPALSDEELGHAITHYDRGFLKPEIIGKCTDLVMFLRKAGSTFHEEPFKPQTLHVTDHYCLLDNDRDLLLTTPHLESVKTLRFVLGDAHNIFSELAYEIIRRNASLKNIEQLIVEHNILQNDNINESYLPLLPHLRRITENGQEIPFQRPGPHLSRQLLKDFGVQESGPTPG